MTRLRFAQADSIGYAFYVPAGTRLMDALVGLWMCESNKEAKELIRGGGVRVLGQVELDPNRVFEHPCVRYRISIGSGVGLVKSGLAAKAHEIEVKE